MRRERRRAERLRLVVDSLPYGSRLAMLEGLRHYRIIAGAYSSRDGGVCPMLAAHRCGGRTDVKSFARAWDRFTGVRKRSRRATTRELRTLTAQLEASIWAEEEAREGRPLLEVPTPRRGVAAHGPRPPAREPRVPAPGPPEQAPEEPVQGEAWLLPVLEWDAYAKALRLALGEADTARPEREREPA